MKEYKFETAAEFDTAMSEFATDFFEAVKSAVINHKVYGSGIPKALNLHTYNNAVNAIVSIAFPEQDVRFPLSAFFEGFLTAPDDEISEAVSQYAEVYKKLTEQREELRKADADAARAAVKKAEAERKAAEVYEKQKQSSLKRFDQLAANHTYDGAVNAEYWHAVGYLAKHAGTINAKLPDYLEPAFDKAFGTDAPRTIIDNSKKTSSGNAMQYSFSFHASLKKVGETLPAYIAQLTENTKTISNVSFIWDLISNRGFNFGKTHDVEAIRSHVPAEYLFAFEEGFAL